MDGAASVLLAGPLSMRRTWWDQPPIFIAVQDTDTVASAQTLAKVLKTQGWPHRLVIAPSAATS